MDVDDPAVAAAVLAIFERYEHALLANDVDGLDTFMWQDDRTVRVGVDDREDGFAAISAFRRAQARQTPPRILTDTSVVTFGDSTAVVTTTFVPTDASPPGRQQQTWVRFDGPDGGSGWRIVAAHVSLPASWNRQPIDQEP